MRYRIELSYMGTAYHGWQRQPNAVTVQQVLEDALATLVHTQIEVVGAGRTDTGVHARYYVAHADMEALQIPETRLVHMLNGILPHDIAVSHFRATLPDFHARFDALNRTYKYYISRVKDPFWYERAMYFPAALNFEAMQRAAKLLLTYNDFAAFCRTGTDVHTTLCQLHTSTWHMQENLLVYTIQADRFLRNMVRAIVGTMLDVGQEHISLDDFCAIIESRDRCHAGASAPACGLYLVDVQYP